MANATELLNEAKALIEKRNELYKKARSIKKHAPATFASQRLINFLNSQAEELQEDINANIALAEIILSKEAA